MRSSLLITVAIIVACLSGWAHGLLVDRWGPPSNVLAAAQHVEELNLEIDGWTGAEKEPIADLTRKVAGAQGYFSRRYQHDETGATTHVTILCGRPGPIAIHTPLYCFELSGMRQLSDETQATLSGENEATDKSAIPATFWAADFRPPESAGGPEIKTFWSWSTDGQSWSTPEDPRIHYAPYPYLYRIYFTAPVGLFGEDTETTSADNPAIEFMNKFLARFAESARNTLSQ